MVQPLWRSLAVPQKVKNYYMIDPAIPLLGIDPKEWNAGTRILAHSCSPRGIDTYSVLKREGILMHAVTSMNAENIK